MILLFLAACGFGLDQQLPRGAVPWECTFAFTHDTGTEEGTWDQGKLSCADYRDHGEVEIAGYQAACEEAGEDEGADEVECACEFDVPDTCTGAVSD